MKNKIFNKTQRLEPSLCCPYVCFCVSVHVFVQITKLCEGVIQVHAPQHTKVSMAIQLEEKTTAKDVTARFEGQNR